MNNSLLGKVALVTGGSRGIGAAIATRLAREGADVAFTFLRNTERADDVVEAIKQTGRRALAIRADSANEEAVTSAVERAAAELGRLDILVNNAGAYDDRRIRRIGLGRVRGNARGQRTSAVPRRADRDPAPPAGWPDHQHRQHGGGPVGLPRLRPLHHEQVRPDRFHQGAGPRTRPEIDHREPGEPGRHRHRTQPGQWPLRRCHQGTHRARSVRGARWHRRCGAFLAGPDAAAVTGRASLWTAASPTKNQS